MDEVLSKHRQDEDGGVGRDLAGGSDSGSFFRPHGGVTFFCFHGGSAFGIRPEEVLSTVAPEGGGIGGGGGKDNSGTSTGGGTGGGGGNIGGAT